MSNSSKKLQQRAQLISILDKYRNCSKIDNFQLKNDIDIILNFENKEFLFKTLLQEISSSKGSYCDVCSIILIETLEIETFEKLALRFLQDKKIEDSKKFLIMSLMKQKGLNFNYKDIGSFVDNPESLAHNGVKEFLGNAIYEPDVQIDLLDFFIHVPDDEKILFLENLQEEFEGDNLANAFSILAQLKVSQNQLVVILETLLLLDSPYVTEGLDFILKNHKIETKTKAKIRNKIKRIKEKYPNFKNDIFANRSKIDKCYIGFIDGKSNFSLVLTRKKSEKLLDVLLLTMNINLGLTSAMGFCDIDIENYNSIIKRLFSDSPPIKISAIALKSLYNHYLKKSKENNIELPYELIVWKNMLNDVREINYDISEFINSKLEIMKLTREKVKKFASSKILETWYYSYGTNEHIDNLIAQIEQNHITNLDEIDELSSKMIDEKFLKDKNFKKELQSKLLLQSYIAHLAKLKLTSACAYSLCYKNPYTKMLIQSSIDKSLYYYFSTRAYELEEENVFKKEQPTNFSKEELELLMAQLEEKWS